MVCEPDAASWRGDLCVLLATPSQIAQRSFGGDANAATAELACSLLEENPEFDGKKAGLSLSARAPPGSPAKSLTIVGIGEGVSPDARVLGDSVASALADSKAVSALVSGRSLDGEVGEGILSRVFTELYRDTRFAAATDSGVQGKSNTLKSVPPISEITIVAPSVDASRSAGLASGVRLAKDLVGAPANFCTPSVLAGVASEIATDDSMSLKILERKDCEDAGMGAYLGVARGSKEPPKFIHLTYTPPGAVKKTVALVGKGLTFDSGGYNLKVGAGAMIELMKFDMGGAAAVLGAAQAISRLQPSEVAVHFIVAACENMVSGDAVRPGDVLEASNGTTIEVINTDAEGRLTLADALHYASGLDTDGVVDLATLTGACVVALGNDYAGLYASSDALAKELQASAGRAGEGLWQMPLADEYREDIKSSIADLKNVGGREGGSITAALFLQEFVGKQTPWAHIDMAGPVWNYKINGSTGYGVSTLVDWVQRGAPTGPSE